MSEMTHKYIAVSYRLFIDGDNGKEMVEEATKEQPFYFLSGFGIALDAFEKKLIDVPQGRTSTSRWRRRRLTVTTCWSMWWSWTEPSLPSTASLTRSISLWMR